MQNTSENDITQIETMQIQEILDLIKSQKFTEAFEKSKLILESQHNEQIAYNFLVLQQQINRIWFIKKQKGFEQIFELCELAMQKKYISQNQFVKLKAMAL